MSAQLRTLDNGLEVIVREDHQHPLVSVQIWVKAGSIHEEKWTGAGLAHCVEHMLFKGTTRRTAQEISVGIQQLGGYVNAYTTFNRTVYWIDGLAENTEGYLDILADMVRHSRFDAAELAKEQDVIRREMAMGNDEPGSQLQHLVQRTSFRTHPLQHPIIGHRAVFDQVKRDDVFGFVQRHYVPNNCFVVIAGAVDAEATLVAVERVLGDWERKPYEPVIQPQEARQLGQRFAHKDFATELSHVALGWQIPGDGHADKPALDVLAFLLGSGRSSRLNQELREKRGIAHSTWAGAWGSQECGVFNTDVECDPENTAICQKAMLEVIRDMKAKGPRKDELAKALRATLGYQLRSLATTKGQAAILGHGWLTTGSLEYPQQYLGKLSRLTPEDIRSAAQKYLLDETCSVVSVGSHVPEKQGALAATSTSDDVQRFTLKNGLTLLVQENPRLPLISIRGSFLAGVPVETHDKAGVTQVSASLLLKGTKTRTTAQISAELENRGGALICQSDAHRYLVGADVMRGDESTGLDLISDLLLNATLPADGLEKVRKLQLAQIQEEKEDPLTVAMRRARAEIFAGQPFARTALGTETTVKALTVADCRAMLRESIVGENGVLSIVGDVKASVIRKQVESAFARLPRGKRREITQFPATKRKPVQPVIPMEKEQAILVIGFRTVGLHSEDVLALTLIDEACSDMGSRLFNRIREELGLAYYVGAQQFAALGAGAFYFYVGTDPKKVDMAQQEMLRLIADLAKNGLTKAEITRAKTAWRSQWLRAQQGNGSMADSYAWNEINGLGYAHFQSLPAKIAAVTDKDIKRAAKAYLDVASATIVRVMPEQAVAG
ncbi:peptidase M16 [Brevifollis gellanilyticus]|uniref:Peptidase M16 n=2 Tax=Brevifollis gellanilyticus TaxID=748831 RepID=A0A512MBZ0_9BACT|nr:peptidase M16 [Brevifollis gellanilyticus]